MLRRINFYSICFAFGLSVLLILAGSRYSDNEYRPYSDHRRNVRVFLRKHETEDTQYVPTNPFDGGPDIDRILERTKLKIQEELTDYNFTHSGVKSIDNLLMSSNGKPVRSVILSTWRSGTTFLGEILDSVPGNFYHYEPLLKYDIIQIRGPPYAEEALNDIKRMMKCDFYGMKDYFEYGVTHLHQFSHNTRLWDHCKYKKELCFDANFTSKFCKLFPFQSMKVVRLRLRLIEEILQDKDLNVKVLLLVRDPRAVIQSRAHRDFCQPSPDCWSPSLLCADMISDYVAASRLMRKYPGKIYVLRYEELALEPEAQVRKLLQFFRIELTASVQEFMELHTNMEVAGVSSTFRVSRQVPFRWKTTLDFPQVEKIQNVCKEAMLLWGYKLADNQTQLASDNFDPLVPYTISQ